GGSRRRTGPPSRPGGRSRSASCASGEGRAPPGPRSPEAAGNLLLDAAGRGERIPGGPDRAADDDVVRPALERPPRRDDPPLVVAAGRRVRRPDARSHDQRVRAEVL